VFVAVEACDMRKGFNGLHALVTQRLGEDPRAGALFVFTNRRHIASAPLEHLESKAAPGRGYRLAGSQSLIRLEMIAQFKVRVSSEM